MSVADLKRLLQRATPRIEDVRSPDRTDFIRREHGHLTLREIVDAVDALEFSVDIFVKCMRDVMESADGDSPAVETALHGLFHAISGLRVLSPALPAPGQDAATTPPEESAEEAEEGWEGRVAEARGKGAECFKAQDFAGAVEQYTLAIRASPRGGTDLHALYSNRSAALLKLGQVDSALADARRCVSISPTWPKGYFRQGSCLRQLGMFAEAVQAFSEGRKLEPGNNDWEQEIERTERKRWEQPALLAQQFILKFLPELLRAWVRGGDPSGVLQMQVNAELKDIGIPKWRLVREGRSDPKAQLRYAFLGRKDYLANLAANLQSPPDGVGVADVEGRQLNIAEIGSFLSEASGDCATVHVDIQGSGKKMFALVVRIPCGDKVKAYMGEHKDPPPPKGSVEGVLNLQKQSGFPKALPSLLGFQSFPGDLNFPVIDIKRDMASGE